MPDIATARWAELSACEIASLVREGRSTAQAMTEAALHAIAERDAGVRAFTEVWADTARAHAAEVQARVEAGERLPLAGVPIGIKAGEGTGSVQSQRMIEAGCVPVGATSVPVVSNAADWQTWGHTDRGPTLNPLNPAWSPGGSSAGSAAAVASGMVPLATGSDGAGSVRIPAAWCAVYGLKPTNGTVPARDAAGLNIAGPLARDAQDLRAAFKALAGADAGTGTPVRRPLRAAWSATLGIADTDPEVAARVHSFVGTAFGDADRLLVDEPDIRLPDPAPCWMALRGHRAAPAEQVEAVRRELHTAVDALFGAYDVLATPTTPHPPHGHSGPGNRMNVALTWAFNITGHPAVSLPAGRTPAGDVVGLQFIARHGREADLLALAETSSRCR
ncbi:amidase [Streptomyces malaysiensis]|uniref:amidase n=1 Tax=Streptomyces malaysiensis TaxID=92644 RepID=UPI00371230E6